MFAASLLRPFRKNLNSFFLGNEPCVAFDVAINTALFRKNRSEIMILTIVEAVADKHGIDLQENGNNRTRYFYLSKRRVLASPRDPKFLFWRH